VRDKFFSFLLLFGICSARQIAQWLVAPGCLAISRGNGTHSQKSIQERKEKFKKRKRKMVAPDCLTILRGSGTQSQNINNKSAPYYYFLF
jgi:hypothetical protein